MQFAHWSRNFPIFQIMSFFCFKICKILTLSVIAVKICQMNLFWAGILAFELSNFQDMQKFFSKFLMSMPWKRTQSYYAIMTCKINWRLSKAELYFGVINELLFQTRPFFVARSKKSRFTEIIPDKSCANSFYKSSRHSFSVYSASILRLVKFEKFSTVPTTISKG